MEKSEAEDGNVSYSLNASVTSPGEYAFIEIWKDEEAFNSHKESEHFTSLFPRIAVMANGEPEIAVYTEV